MKYLSITLLLVLVPLVLMGSFFSTKSTLFPTIPSGKLMLDRSWRVSSILEENYDMAQWNPNHDFHHVYSGQYPTRLDTLKYYNWDDGMQFWELNGKFVHTYDNTQEYVVHTDFIMNMQGTWYPFARNNITYDNQHRLIYVLGEMYNFDTQLWSVYSWTKVDFVNNSNFSVCQYESSTDNRMPRWTKMSFVWDSHGRIIEEVDIVSSDSINWVNSEKYNYTYHPHDTTTGDIFVYNFSRYMPLETGIEDASNQDMFGMLSHEENQYWTGTNWADTYRSDFTYNANDDLTLLVEQHWNNNTWSNNMQIVYTYDTNNNLNQVIQSYNQDGTMELDTRYTYTWSQFTANDDNTAPVYTGLNLSASPNPFAGEVVIKMESKTPAPVKVSIYNSRGQIVRTLNAQTNSSITWDGKDADNNNVSNGIYFLKAAADGATQTIKVVKLK